jgi:thymidylate kinase
MTAGRWNERSAPGARSGRGVSIALIGADGAGKSTVAAALCARFPDRAVRIYMGLYQQGRARRPPGLRLVSSFMGRMWRGLYGQVQQSRGKLVIFDRCSADALLEPIQPLGWAGRIRRWLLAHACPRPDLIVLLDAPGEVLASRAGTHDPVASEHQRQRYLALRQRLPQLVVLDATRSVPDLRHDLVQLVQNWRHHER